MYNKLIKWFAEQLQHVDPRVIHEQGTISWSNASSMNFPQKRINEDFVLDYCRSLTIIVGQWEVFRSAVSPVISLMVNKQVNNDDWPSLAFKSQVVFKSVDELSYNQRGTGDHQWQCWLKYGDRWIQPGVRSYRKTLLEIWGISTVSNVFLETTPASLFPAARL